MKKAFTLAEVLITLGIIGVVAAMTIPALMTKIQHKKLESQFNEAYSLLAQAVKMYNQDEENERRVGKFGEVPLLRKYFKGASSCDNKDAKSATHCIARTEAGDDGSVSTTNKDYKYTNYTKTSEFVFTNSFDDIQFFLLNNMLFITDANVEAWHTILVTVDINGKSAKPNALGHDVFMFELISTEKEGGYEVVPEGAPGTYFADKNMCSNTSTATNNGLACTYEAMKDRSYFKKLR